jgi:DNA adenine methylase
MQYLGSKRFIVKEILPIILKKHNFNNFYVEPFCGGLNVAQHVKGNKIINDSNKYLIALFDYCLKGGPVDFIINKEEYHSIKNNKDDYPDWLVGYAGFLSSPLGKFMGSYFLRKNNNFQLINALKKTITNLIKSNTGILLLNNESYDKLYIPENSTIYCDPPYLDKTKYKGQEFNYDNFLNWLLKMKENKCTIYFSEGTKMNDFELVWEKTIIHHFYGNKFVKNEFLYKV